MSVPPDDTNTKKSTDFIATAVEALTAAAKQSYTTPSGANERYDFGEIACQVIATVAANLGGVEALLAGRPGSWEADRVRQMVHSTVFEDDLLKLRTEPVRLLLNPDEVLNDLGLWESYEDAERKLNEEWDRAHAQYDAELESAQADSAADGPVVDTEARWDALMGPVDAKLTALEDLWQSDLATYTITYTAVVQQVAAERGITVPVLVDRDDDNWTGSDWFGLEYELHEHAVARTPLPASGIAPERYDGVPGVVDRAEGRTYTSRLAAAHLATQSVDGAPTSGGGTNDNERRDDPIDDPSGGAR